MNGEPVTHQLTSLETVTLTGADESINPRDLIPLTNEFPFVEWGILIGSQNKPRYPSVEWIRELVEVRCETGNRMQLALHVCGKFLREIATGHSSLMDVIGPAVCAFGRVQLNWHGNDKVAVGRGVMGAFCGMMPWEPELIFQLKDADDEIHGDATRRFRCSGLFDNSGGRGVLPSDWPSPRTDMRSGWSGGLGPDNLAEHLPTFEAKCFGAYWVDMETKLRTYVPATATEIDTDRFDLEKCRECLEIAAKFMSQS